VQFRLPAFIPMTKFVEINPEKIDSELIKEAADIIKSGGLVAFPTETVYGLGANALDNEAVFKIFKAKNRPADNPLIVHVSSLKMLNDVVLEIPSIAKKLIKKYWPGPLTLVLKKSSKIPSVVTCGLDSVAVRMPSNKIALELIKKSGVPIAAPSANLSKSPSPTRARHVFDDMNGRIDMILNGGECNIGLESTVLDVSEKLPRLLRPGKVTLEELEKFIGKIEVNFTSEKPASPGMKYKHYSPKAQVFLLKKNDIEKKLKELKNQNKKVAVFVFDDLKLDSNFYYCFNNDLELMAKELFNLFRIADEKNIDTLLIEEFEEKGLGRAIMNRAKKAASTV
jgi:L-threonylcarbamoyladenylate synthase